MEEGLKYYLENTAVTKAAIESRLTHPVTVVRYPNRSVYVLLRKYADDFLNSGSEPRFVSLAGLRGVGKTTLLWQTANHIHSTYHKDIYFFNVNTLKTLGVSLHAALEEFQRDIIKKRFNELSKPITLLFDEVHDDDNWSRSLKILYDEARTAFIVCTGSSALLLNQTADLARRMRTEKIYPFKFSEFIMATTTMEANSKALYPVKGLSGRLMQSIFYSEDAAEMFEGIMAAESDVNKYLADLHENQPLKLKELLQGYISYRNIPNFLFHQNKYTINDSILDLFKRVILQDIPKLNPTLADHTKIEKLILRLAGSDEINPEKLAGIIGVKHYEINDLIEILAKAELINVLLPYGGIDTRIAKNKKAFFMSPSLRRALLSSLYGQSLPDQYKSKLTEDIVVMYLKSLLTDGVVSFMSGSDTTNPDFVIETRDKPILLEIGSKKTTTRQIRRSNIDYRYGVLVSDSVTSPVLKRNVLHIPLIWFLLL